MAIVFFSKEVELENCQQISLFCLSFHHNNISKVLVSSNLKLPFHGGKYSFFWYEGYEFQKKTCWSQEKKCDVLNICWLDKNTLQNTGDKDNMSFTKSSRALLFK